MEIKKIDLEIAEKYIDDIAYFIYESVKMSAFEDSYCIDDAQQKANELRVYLKKDKAIVLGAFHESDLVGFLWAYEYPFREDQNRLYVSVLHVKAEYRNKHIGQYLLDEIESIARKNEYTSVFLHAEAENIGAVRFYGRMNYQSERIQFVKKLVSSEV